MKIKKSIFEAIMRQCPFAPPETGGIIGGRGELITDVIFDKSPKLTEQAMYCPDVDYLNDRITWWHTQHIEFRGIFHSHPTNQCNLSGNDREYIIEIMSAMPASIEDLFFPIIIPKRDVLVYRARRRASEIVIQADYLQKVRDEQNMA